MNPALKSHKETRDCFFDFKEKKADLQKSLRSGQLCPEHREQIASAFTPEVSKAFEKMTRAMKSLRQDATEELPADSLKGHVDIGIITMKPEEHKAVLDRFTRRRKVMGGGSNYSYTRLRTHRNEELRVVIGRTAAQAQGSAQALASSMLVDLNPRWLFVVGIAGAVPATEFSLGDVLISQRVHDFSVSAAKEGKPTEYEDLGGPMAAEVEKLVKDLPDWQSELGDWFSEESIGRARPKVVIPSKPEQKKELLYGPDGWQKDVIDGLKANFLPRKRRQPICLPATFITSNTLVKDTQLVKSWLINARQSLSVEMELAGVMNAARSVGDEKTCVLAVRGISDVVGYKRKPEWTEYACQSAAAFTYALLVSGLIRPKKP